MGKAPEMKDPKSSAASVPVSPLSTTLTQTTPMPRMMFNQQGGGLGTAMMNSRPQMGAAPGGMGPNINQYAMDLLRRGGGA